MADVDYYTGLTVADIEKNIMWELGQVVGTTVSYSKFPQWLIRQKMNDLLQKFCFISQCNLKFALLLCKENYRDYVLPSNCMDAGVVSARYFSSSTEYEDLKIVDRNFLDQNYPGWLGHDASSPTHCYQGYMFGNRPVLGVYPKPEDDGTSYATDPDTGITVGDDLPGATSNITGAATGGSDTTLEDTEVDFTDMGLVAGMTVKNVTDGSEATISSVAETAITLSAALSGGTDDTFEAGDSYLIFAGEYGVLTSWTDGEQYLFESEEGVLSTITVPAGNIWVDYIPFAKQFPATGQDEKYPEIPKLYHMDYAMGVVGALLRTFHENTREHKRAEYYENLFRAAALQAKSKKDSRPFLKKARKMYPYKRRRRG